MEYSIIDFMLCNGVYEEIKYTKEYKRVSEKRFRIHEELTEMLTEEQKELFDKFVNLEIDETALSNEAYFKFGMKMGIRLLSECMFDF